MAEGKVFLVGAGPGDPGLLTVRGRELIDGADAIVYDALANPALLPPDAVSAGFPELFYVGKRGGDKHSVTQEDINLLLIRLAREGKRVVRLKGGDPFVFGRGSEEAIACSEAGVPCEVVPGITAGIAAPAYAGIPVTHRGMTSSVTLVTVSEDPARLANTTNWAALAKSGSTIVLYAGAKTLPRATTALMDGGLPSETPAAAVQWGTHSKQRTVVATLGSICDEIARQNLKAPLVTVIGWSVLLRDEIAWFERRPLFGKRIVVTRASDQAPALSGRLRELGADVMEVPTVRIARLDLAPLRSALEEIASYDWIVFTSRNGVAVFWEQLLSSGRDARSLAGVKIAAVGAATAGALLERGIAVDVIPERFVAEGLIDALRERDELGGASVLHVGAEGARDVLRAGLEALGAVVTLLPVYRSVPQPEGAENLRAALEHGEIDLVTLTSASSVSGLVDGVGQDAARAAPAASIGPITSEAARAAGIEVAIEATESTIDGLVDAIVSAHAGG
ncbi:MAG TPA: uroporphyrinogen-III C-methyltransferase [Gemmatimonadaceae bacterium]|nr:uroporphyrinogen-III C-methyltransferase [Gemmatimonadaceae bacterium]